MKIIIHLKDKQYEKAIKRLLNYKWRLKEFIKFEEYVENVQKEEILLTDDIELFNRSKLNGFLLSEYHDLKERMVGKYVRFETILQMLHPEISGMISKEHHLKVIAISSMHGGSGKSTILKHLSHYLSRDYNVCALNLFQVSQETSDLCEFFLEYRNSKNISNRYFYKENYCQYVMNGFRNAEDMEEINCSELYNSLTEFLRGRSFDILLFEVSHPFITFCRHFIKTADYNLIVRDCRREENHALRGYLRYLNIVSESEFMTGASYLMVDNFFNCDFQAFRTSKSDLSSRQTFDSSLHPDCILELPYDEEVFKANKDVNENSVFYSKIRKFAQGVFHV